MNFLSDPTANFSLTNNKMGNVLEANGIREVGPDLPHCKLPSHTLVMSLRHACRADMKSCFSIACLTPIRLASKVALAVRHMAFCVQQLEAIFASGQDNNVRGNGTESFHDATLRELED